MYFFHSMGTTVYRMRTTSQSNGELLLVLRVRVRLLHSAGRWHVADWSVQKFIDWPISGVSAAGSGWLLQLIIALPLSSSLKNTPSHSLPAPSHCLCHKLCPPKSEMKEMETPCSHKTISVQWCLYFTTNWVLMLRCHLWTNVSSQIS